MIEKCIPQAHVKLFFLLQLTNANVHGFHGNHLNYEEIMRFKCIWKRTFRMGTNKMKPGSQLSTCVLIFSTKYISFRLDNLR